MSPVGPQSATARAFPGGFWMRREPAGILRPIAPGLLLKYDLYELPFFRVNNLTRQVVPKVSDENNVLFFFGSQSQAPPFHLPK